MNKRLGHVKFDSLVKISLKGLVRHIPKFAKADNIISKGCQQGKKSKVKFPIIGILNQKTLEIIHMDLCGPIRKRAFQG
jgi:hypothetical protein